MTFGLLVCGLLTGGLVSMEDQTGFKLTPGIPQSGYPDVDYTQPNRPQFHFSSKKNWINDPNGMVFDGKQYHLFFQHNPNGTDWGNMTWGHAVSKDMLHWEQLDHSLLPYSVDGRSGTIFSGSAVIDHQNLLGKQVGKTKTICAFFTYASEPKFYQAMAYSTDGGKSFTYWNEGRAVVAHQGFDNGERDPRVFWDAASKQYVMVVWMAQNPGRFRFFTSKNLTDWTFTSDFVAPWPYECPDIFFLPVDGNRNNTKCVIADAGFTYEVGHFDGKKFVSESAPLHVVRGNYYAAQTFTNTPGGRIVQIGWMRGPFNAARSFGVPFNQQMSIPNELTLRTTSSGVRLFSYPIEEVSKLATQRTVVKDWELSRGRNIQPSITNLDLVDVSLEITVGDSTEIKIELPRTVLTYNVRDQKLTHLGVNGDGKPVEVTTLEGLAPRHGKVQLRLLLDRMTVEAYAFGGEKFGAHYIYPDPTKTSFGVSVDGTSSKVNSLTVAKLSSVWKSQR